MLIGLAMLTGIPFSIYYGDDDIRALLISGLITFAVGFITWLFTRGDTTEIDKREGYVIVSLGWISMSVFGSLPFIIHGAIPDYTNAFFETISGFTTTGATILTDIEALPHGLLFWRSLTQWLGGMGIIVLSLAILPILGIGGMQLFIAEAPGPTKDKIHPRIQETAKRLWGIYFILTLSQVIFLMIGGLNLFDSLNHAFTTMATGGFSTKNSSIAYYNSPFVQYVFILFMFFAGTNFTIHYLALHKKFGFFKINSEFKFYLFITLLSALVVMIIHLPYQSLKFEESFRQSLFHVVSLITTTGFTTSDYENWAPYSRMIFFALLFIGGCAGSTGGGIKVIRHFILYKNSLLELKRLVHPRAVIPVRVNGKAVNPEIISVVQAFFILYILIFVFTSIIVSLLGLDFASAAGAVAACLGNIGPGIGIVGPAGNFAALPDLVKWILSALMLIGRLELFTVLLLFAPSFWKK